MRIRTWLIVPFISLLLTAPAGAWEESNRQAYNNKMSLLKVLLDGAQQRATNTGDLETLCMLMSIGNDVTLRYAQLNPQDLEIQNRLTAMRDDLTVCLAVLYNPQALK
ncbi:MAG: hypothetical protein ISQ52_01085 [Synechococcus sp. BS307-5m-G38]|jgi:hypothetical protein|nr:hypothetical protein [Synechococcus sp. BS307-5m-G38]